MPRSRTSGIGHGALTAILIGALGACGSGSDTPDGGVTLPPDGGGADALPASCNPVVGTGCQPGEKCTYVVDSADPFLGHTGCAPAGSVATGGACEFDANGVDNCQAGNWCSGGVCEEICSLAPDSCGQDSACVGLRIGTNEHVVFGDVDGTGLCSPTCDVLDQDLDQSSDDGTCAAGEGCYLGLFSGKATCAVPFVQATQDEDCTALNGCAIGFGCALNNHPDPEMANGLWCAFYCDATSDVTGGPTCALDGPGPAYGCVPIKVLYNNVSQAIPDNVGLCLKCDDWGVSPCQG